MVIKYDCVVIGAGQSGLYAAKCLGEKNINYIVLEGQKIGDVWRNRLAVMRLFTSRQFCGLPGMTFPGDQDGFPAINEMADYLQEYARHFSIIISENTQVINLAHDSNEFIVSTSNGESIRSRSVINATGANQKCIVPTIANGLSPDVDQLTADAQSLDKITQQKVAIIGDGASGRQIAALLRKQDNEVTLATGRKRGLPPNRVLGRDIFWWLKKIGVLFADKNSKVAKILQKRNPVPCGEQNNQRLKDLGVNIVGRAISCNDQQIRFNCGHQGSYNTVIWSVGYYDEVSWMHINNCVNNGEFVQEYGLTPQAGLFTIGRKWLSCRASELIMGVERDVDRTMVHLNNYLR